MDLVVGAIRGYVAGRAFEELRSMLPDRSNISGSKKWSGGGGGGNGGLKFPSNLPDHDIPIVINFKCDRYSNLMKDRVKGANGDLANITLPLSHLATESLSLYTSSTTETGSIWDAWGPKVSEMWATKLGFTNLLGDFTGWNAKESERPMDLRDATYRGHSLRTHRYSWTLIPRNREDGAEIAEIAKAFQTLSYPELSEDSQYSRIIHPPIWDIAVWNLGWVFEGTNADEWSLSPQKCVLESAKVETAGVAAGGVYVVDGGYPAATRISLVFKELEAAVKVGEDLVSRSQARVAAG